MNSELKRRSRTALAATAALAAAALLAAPRAVRAEPGAPPVSGARARAAAAFGRLPLAFEANRGQTDGGVAFLARGADSTLFLTDREAVLELADPAPAERPAADRGTPRARRARRAHIVRLRFAAAGAAPRAAGEGELPWRSHELVDGRPRAARTGLPNYARVRYRGVAPGVDLVFYGNGRRLEHDFVLAPGADPRAARLEIAGADAASLDRGGDLVLALGGRALRLSKPAAYQEVGGVRRAVASAYRLLPAAGGAPGAVALGFTVGEYDRARPLVIDPVLVYSTSLGPGVPQAIDVDSDGNAYLAGDTGSLDFPTTPGVVQPAAPEETDFHGDGFVVALTPSGAVRFSTYLATDFIDDLQGIVAAPGCGGIFVAGTNASDDFEVAYVERIRCDGGALEAGANVGEGERTRALGIAFDGDVYVVGSVELAGDPFTPSGAFIQKFDYNLHELYYVPLGSGGFADEATAVAVDGRGNAYAAGTTGDPSFPTLHAAQPALRGPEDAFVVKLGPDGTRLYSTFLGGSGRDEAHGIAVDSLGGAYVTGQTTSADFPVRGGAQAHLAGGADAFVSAFYPAGPLAASTYLGGSGSDVAAGVALDGAGNVYLAGTTSSSDFPAVDPLPYHCAAAGCLPDAFVAQLDHTLSHVLFASRLGGSGGDQALGVDVDPQGNVYLAVDGSADFPVVGPASHPYRGEAFAVKIAPNHPPVCTSAHPSPAVLSPADGRLVPIAILGVSDPEGGAVAISILSIAQDEPTGGAPDASGIGTATAEVQASRDAAGDGRVYHVRFQATDGEGAACTGSVLVCVPAGSGRSCVDGGALYPSTAAP